MKLLSLLVPTYNRVDFTKQLISSLYDQCKKDGLEESIEIIVCDNSSNVDQKLLLVEFVSTLSGLVKLYDTGENIGPVKNWMQCIFRAKSEYCLFVFSDDYLLDGSLNKMRDFLQCDNYDSVFLKANILINNQPRDYLDFRSYHELDCKTVLRVFLTTELLPVTPGCVIMRTSVLKSISFDSILLKYKASVKTGSGVDLFIVYSAIVASKNILFHDEVSVILRDHSDSFTGNLDTKKDVLITTILLRLELIRRHYGFLTYLYFAVKRQLEIRNLRMRINLLFGNY
jgi:glycosyltransferase involved in cell wall biosynthesis